MPLGGAALQAWKRRINLLAGIRLPAGKAPKVSVRTGEIRPNTWLSVVALSPWVIRAKPVKGQPHRPYHRAEGGGISLWRLLAAAACATEIMQHPELANYGPVLGLALHAWEVLKTTNWQGLHNLNEGMPLAKTIEDLPAGQAARSMPVPMWGLSLFVWRRLKQIGAGESSEVGPGLIADYLLDEPDLAPAERGSPCRRARSVHRLGPRRADRLLPPARTCLGRADGAKGPGRESRCWAERVPRAVARSEMLSRSAKDSEATLAVHFGIMQAQAFPNWPASAWISAWSVHFLRHRCPSTTFWSNDYRRLAPPHGLLVAWPGAALVLIGAHGIDPATRSG